MVTVNMIKHNRASTASVPGELPVQYNSWETLQDAKNRCEPVKDRPFANLTQDRPHIRTAPKGRA